MCNWCYTHNPDRDDTEDREEGMKKTEETERSKYDERDAKNDTRASDAEVSYAWHTARDDAEKIGWVPKNRHDKDEEDDD